MGTGNLRVVYSSLQEDFIYKMLDVLHGYYNVAFKIFNLKELLASAHFVFC